jgi:hypothetical protein
LRARIVLSLDQRAGVLSHPNPKKAALSQAACRLLPLPILFPAAEQAPRRRPNENEKKSHPHPKIRPHFIHSAASCASPAFAARKVCASLFFFFFVF